MAKNITFGVLFFVAAFIVGASFIGCGSRWKAKRDQRRFNELVGRNPEFLTAVTDTDTVVVYVPAAAVDTVVVVLPGDSIVIEHDRVRVVLQRMPGDTFYMRGECKEDTVVEYRDRVVYAPTVTKEVEVLPWWVWPSLLLVTSLLVVTMLANLFRRS